MSSQKAKSKGSKNDNKDNPSDKKIKQNEGQSNPKTASTQQEKKKKKFVSYDLSTPSNYIHSKDNINNLKTIKSSLQTQKDYFNQICSILKDLKEENDEIDELELYKGEDKINNLIDDELFENKVKRLFSNVYGLKEKILYPYFSVEYSRNKKSNIIKLYYNKVKFLINGKKSTSFIFLDDRDTYMIYFDEMPILFQKYKGEFNTMSVIMKDYKNFTDFPINKENNVFQTSFLSAEICEELLDIKGKVKEIKNKIDSLNYIDINQENFKEKIILKEKLKLHEEKYNLIKKKYSKERLNYELNKKIEELQLLELEIKLEEIKDVNDERKNLIKKEIQKYKDLLKIITIKIQRLELEFDGFFISKEEIKLENTIGDKLIIPPKSPIILEVENHSKFGEIVSNLRKKKKILESIGFKENCFYFVGVLRNLIANEKLMEEIDKIKENFDFKNTIIIYPMKSKLFSAPLYNIKEASKEVKSKREKMIERLIDIMDKKYEKMKDEIRKDFLGIDDNKNNNGI